MTSKTQTQWLIEELNMCRKYNEVAERLIKSRIYLPTGFEQEMTDNMVKNDKRIREIEGELKNVIE